MNLLSQASFLKLHPLSLDPIKVTLISLGDARVHLSLEFTLPRQGRN